MSHNVWKCDDNQPAWEEKGLDCSAPVRSKGMVRVYTETHPDIIGFQEMSYVMSEKIIGGLLNQGYRYALLWGKDTPILYRQYRLELLDSDFLLYPMEIPGYDGQFNNQDTKSWCIGVFRDKTDGYKPYVNKPFEKAIDHILVKFAPENFVRRFERYTLEYYLPLSDHSPVFADIEL